MYHVSSSSSKKVGLVISRAFPTVPWVSCDRPPGLVSWISRGVGDAFTLDSRHGLVTYGAFHGHGGSPIWLVYVRENPTQKWINTRASPFSGNHHIMMGIPWGSIYGIIWNYHGKPASIEMLKIKFAFRCQIVFQTARIYLIRME